MQLAAGIPATGLPVPLGILAALQAFGALVLLAMVFIMPVTIMFGAVLRGAAAISIFLVYAVLNGYAAWMILRRKLIGWQIVMFTVGFGIISMLVTFVRRPDMLQLFRELGYNSPTLGVYEQFPQLLVLIWGATFVGRAAFLVFILYTRRFFPKEG
jgi:hypothetical protein